MCEMVKAIEGLKRELLKRRRETFFRIIGKMQPKSSPMRRSLEMTPALKHYLVTGDDKPKHLR